MSRVTRCSGSDLWGGVRGCARVLALCPGRFLALDRVPSRAFPRPPSRTLPGSRALPPFPLPPPPRPPARRQEPKREGSEDRSQGRRLGKCWTPGFGTQAPGAPLHYPLQPCSGTPEPLSPRTDWRSSPLKPPREGKGRILNLSLTSTSATPSESALVGGRPRYSSPLMTLPTPARGCNGANPPRVFWAAFVSAYPRGGAGRRLGRCGGVSVTLGSARVRRRQSPGLFGAPECAVPTWLRRPPHPPHPRHGAGRVVARARRRRVVRCACKKGRMRPTWKTLKQFYWHATRPVSWRAGGQERTDIL